MAHTALMPWLAILLCMALAWMAPARAQGNDAALPVRDQVQITPQRNTSLAGFDRALQKRAVSEEKIEAAVRAVRHPALLHLGTHAVFRGEGDALPLSVRGVRLASAAGKRSRAAHSIETHRR